MTAGPPTLSIVIPAYNEERVIAASVEQIAAFLEGQAWNWDVLVVDDGSQDGTAEVVERIARASPRVALRREPHRGKGAAVKTGMLAARGAYRFMCDADLSMPIAELPRFLPPLLAGADVAIGSREGNGARRVGEPWRRHIVGRAFNFAIQRLALPGIEDTQCGFKMFTAASADAVFSRVTLPGWAFDVEALSLARAFGLRIAEVPIEWHFRPVSRVSMVRDSWRMLRDVWRVGAASRGRAGGGDAGGR